MISHLFRFVHRLSAAVCRHPEGIVCEHRQYESDLRLTGYCQGFSAGYQHAEAKWRGNVYSVGPYADYPPPALQEEKR